MQFTPLQGRCRPQSIYRGQRHRSVKFEANSLGHSATAVPICDCFCDPAEHILDMAATALKCGVRN